VLDHDDSPLKFEKNVYTQTLGESADLYENFATASAKDQDCTNAGYACSYKLLTKFLDDIDDESFAFKVDSTGALSTRKAMLAGENFEFTVRAFDCVSKESFVDARVKINVVAACTPEWTGQCNLNCSDPIEPQN
jgi:hypothetical protein